MSDETFLEAFIESISTLPHDVRRNLELLKDMDANCSSLVDQLTHAEQEYVRRAEAKVLQLELGTTSDGRPGVHVLGGKSKEVVVPTTEELSAYVHDQEALALIKSLRASAMQQADEKVAIAEQTHSIIDATVDRLDSDIAVLENMLKRTGEFQDAEGGKPNDLAAVQVDPASPEWILAKVISHDTATGMYTLSDEDTESNKIFHLPESQVTVLGGLERLSKGDPVFAVYPDTTSFYQAKVVQSLRKSAGGGTFVMVNFVDDSDEHGVTHDKAVLLQHIMRPPYGAVLQ
jgi:hypothetical protein